MAEGAPPPPGRRAVALGLGAVALLLAAGGGWLLARSGGPGRGTVLVVATVSRPVPAAARETVRPTGLSLHRAGWGWGRGWTTLPVRAGAVALPGRLVAPGEATWVQLQVPVGRYDGVGLSWRGPGGRVHRERTRAGVRVAATGLTPLLLALRLGGPGVPPVRLAAAYGGNAELNFGLQVAAGTELAVPGVTLTDQRGRPVSLRQFRGRVMVLASFLTECQETCPLVDAALLRVERQLQSRGLQHRVAIVMVTQEPQVDTPVAIARYARYFHLPFTLLTGSVAAVNRFWTRLHIPLPVNQPIRGVAPVDPFTRRRETSNPLHASVVMVVDPSGQVVSEVLGQPTIRAGIPTLIARYLDQLGRRELRSGGSWSPTTVVDQVLAWLQTQGVGGAFPTPSGVARVGRVGQLAPLPTLPSSRGGWVSLARLRGHPLILDFWASWCVNCRAELPLLDRTARRDAARGVRLVLINYQQTRSTAVGFLHRLGIDRPTLLDPQGTVAQRFGVVALPVNVFLTAAGRISGIQVGQLGRSVLAAQLRPILAPPAAPR